jgi:uncharacterized protein (TIGR03083 family)
MTTALQALGDECRALCDVLATVGAADLGTVTNCPPWTLRELVVHIGESIHVGDEPFAPAAPDVPAVSAAAYYRRPERATPEYRWRNVEGARTRAGAVPRPVSWLAEVVGRCTHALSGQNPDRVVVVPGRGPMRLSAWTVTRVVSVAAHGLDVAITLGREPWTTPTAARVMRPVFDDLLGGPPPAGLAWDDRTLLATATGRRPVSADDRAVLGPLAARFPLLS